MKYILIGFLLSIGWHAVKLVYHVFLRVLHMGLTRTKPFMLDVGAKSIKFNDVTGDTKMIGFE